MRRWVHLAFGVAFGFVLSGSGAADFDAMSAMFMFKSFHLYGVAMATLAITAVGLHLLKRRGRTPQYRPAHRGTAWGAAIFGAGWGITGACPGTAIVQLGNGHLIALATVAGIFAGTLAHDFVNTRLLKFPSASC